jgi:hypothetical protein
VLSGCGSDCRVVCEKEQECLSADLNIDTCNEKADDDEDYADKTKECAECVSERVCSETFKSCLDDCFGVIGDNR